MKKCLHNVQKRLATVDIASISGIAMWCINCGAIKLGSEDWQLPLMRPPSVQLIDDDALESD